MQSVRENDIRSRLVKLGCSGDPAVVKLVSFPIEIGDVVPAVLYVLDDNPVLFFTIYFKYAQLLSFFNRNGRRLYSLKNVNCIYNPGVVEL